MDFSFYTFSPTVDGFACLIIGTLIYNKVMNLSFIRGCGDPQEDEQPVISIANAADEHQQREQQFPNQPGVADGDEIPILSEKATRV
ncbi:hypothetical protein FBUS_11274 [Fasciolopsis buskii]|uniref:Uncharacterized protein n=1 Tax=Fasciolopsis buskii TaxID=27845 RepID=A0A8E0VFV3_9TREM|nr:hypothetical protein FBUS_11274 [Fasciolopsis buski]